MYNKLLISAGGGIISAAQQAEQENCATIAIGLGGTGISCLRNLKKEVFTRVRPDNLDAPVAEYNHIKFLAIDTDKTSIGETGSIDTLDANTEFFNISCLDIPGLLFHPHMLAQNSSLNWLKTKNTQGDGSGISILSTNSAPCGVRQIGRLCLFLQSKSFVHKLEKIIYEAIRDLTNFDLNIHIFTGLMGGTGSGIFLDVCYLVQHVLQNLGLAGRAHTFGYFFLPDVNMANHPIECLPINGFAAMKELDYCMNFDNNGGEWNQQYDGFSIKTSEPPVKLAHLISATGSSGNIIANAYNYAMNVVTDYVLDIISSPLINSLIAAHVRPVNKKHGATYNYCILGAASAYLPYKDITTYLTSKIFEGFADLPKQSPLDSDFDLFVNNNRLKYKDIYRELCEKMPAVPNIPVDYKTLYQQEEGISVDSIPQLLTPMRDVSTKIAGQLETNKAALLNQNSKIAAANNGVVKLSLIERIRDALTDIAKQANKGPYYASEMLHSLKARDLQKIVVAYKIENDRAISNAMGDLKLREKSVESALNALQNSNLINRKKRAVEYVDAVHAYYVQRYKIDALTKMGELLAEFEKQLSALYNGYFSIFASVMKELQATFDANRETLSQPPNDDDGYVVKLMTIQELQESLDASVAAMDIPGQIHGFVSDMLNNSEAWVSQDENKIFTQVNKYFLSQLSQYTSRTIDDYLKIKFETDNPTQLQNAVYNNIITPLGSKSAPMFWTDNDIYKLSDSVSMGYLSIPNISNVIAAAAQQFRTANPDISVRTAWETDRITIFKFACGVPMFGYKGVTAYKKAYRQKKVVGSHLYEGSRGDARDGRKLIDISPISCIPEDKYTPDELLKIEAYDFALENNIVTKVSVDNEYHLNIFDDEEIKACIETMQKIIDANDDREAIEFIDSRKNKEFTVKAYRTIYSTQNFFAEIVVKDHILGSVLFTGILMEQVENVKRYSEKFKLLSDLAKSAEESQKQ